MICVLCEHCGGEHLKRDGKSLVGKQRFKCKGCGRRSCENPYRGRSAEKEAQVLALHLERTSGRGISRALKVSRVTVAELVKKRPSN